MTGRAFSRRRFGALLAAGVAGPGVLAGCAGGLAARTVDVSVDTSPQPVLLVPQARGIVAAVDEALARAARSQDPADLGRRVWGPYRRIWTVRRQLAAAAGSRLPAPPAVDPQRIVITRDAGWPRSFTVLGGSPDLATPVVRVYVCADARSPYGLWAQMSLLPGASYPAVNGDGSGVPVLGKDAGGLVATPRATVQRYAELLQAQGRGSWAGWFSQDQLRSQVVAKMAADRAALAPVATMSATYAADPDRLVAMRTADGGAVVTGQITRTVTIAVKKDAGAVQLDPQTGILAGGRRFQTSVRRTTLELVTFHVPAAGGGPITAVAAEQQLVAATAR